MFLENNYAEETYPLFRLLKTEAFRFVIIRYNHYSLLQQLKQDLRQRFPDRPFTEVDATQITYREMVDSYYKTGFGFYCIDNFRALLNNPELYAGLNQRRDKLAKYPIAIIAFVEPPTEEQFATQVMEKMPDLWSFRSLLLDLKTELNIVEQPTFSGKSEASSRVSTLGGNTKEKKTEELNRLLAKIAETPQPETAYLKTQYEQVAQLQVDIGNYRDALNTYDKLINTTNSENERASHLIDKGDVLITIGELNQALKVYEEAKNLIKQDSDQYTYGVALERIGNTYADLGNLDKALSYYEEYNHWNKKLYETYPENVGFKNLLAISYFKLGQTHASNGNPSQSMTYYEEYNRLEKELYEAYPENMGFKNSLAISYSKLGEMHANLGNLSRSMTYYEDYNRLEKELYEA